MSAGSRGRDRDPAGRARNSRPRDAAGRPLPRAAVGEPQAPEDVALPPLETLAEAQRLLDAGRPFVAHEVLEARWKAVSRQGHGQGQGQEHAHERDLWQGLAQLAVGLTHAQRGNLVGAARLLQRGAARLAPYAGDPPYSINVAGLVAAALQRAARLAASVEASLDWDVADGGTQDSSAFRLLEGASMTNVSQPVTDDSIKIRQLTHYQFSWIAGEPGQPGAYTLQLVLDQGAWEEVLTLDPDDADNLQDMLSAYSTVHYDVGRRVLLFGTVATGS